MKRKLRVEELESRNLLSALFAGGIMDGMGLDVGPSGIAHVAGYTPGANGLRVGQTVDVDTASGVSALSSSVKNLVAPNGGSLTPVAIANVGGQEMLVEWEAALVGGKNVELAFSVNTSTPGVATSLGSIVVAGTTDLTRPRDLNANGTWVGSSSAGAVAVFGPVSGTTISAVPAPAGSLGFDEAVSENGIQVVDIATVSNEELTVIRRPDGSTVTLTDPFASEGGFMFGARISPDGKSVLCNVERFDPVSETYKLQAVVFSGTNWSTVRAITDASGNPYFAPGKDVENSGLVTLALDAGGVALAYPDQAPIVIDAAWAGVSSLQSVSLTLPFGTSNVTVEQNGVTYVLVTGPQGAMVLTHGTPVVITPPPSDPPATITIMPGTTRIIDSSQYHQTLVLTVYAPVTARQQSTVIFVGTADHAITINFIGGAGKNVVLFMANGPITVNATLFGGGDVWDGHTSDAKFIIHAGSGRNVIIGGSNDDVIDGTGSFGVYLGMGGNDRISVTGGIFNFIDGGAGADEIHAGPLDIVFVDGFDDYYGHSLFLFGKPKRRFP